MAFDINAARAQRLEAKGDKFAFVIDGEEFALPTELPVEALDAMKNLDNADLKGVVSTIMGDAEAATRLFAHKLSVQDLAALMDAWRKETGASVGEGSPSAN